jgi:hypothetical protein
MMNNNALSDLRRDDYFFKFVSSTAVPGNGAVNITLAETGWQWGILEFGAPAAVCQFVVSTNGNSYVLFADVGQQFRALTFRIDPLVSVAVNVQKIGAGDTGVILNVARGWPIIPVHSH